MSAVPKNLRSFAGMLESVNEAIKVLDQVESLEQYQNEHQTRVGKLRAEADAAQQSLDAAKAAIAEAQGIAQRTLDQARIDAETVKGKIIADADEIRSLALEAAKKAKLAEAASLESERAAKESTAKAKAELERLNTLAVDAKAIIARAEAIKKAMG